MPTFTSQGKRVYIPPQALVTLTEGVGGLETIATVGAINIAIGPQGFASQPFSVSLECTFDSAVAAFRHETLAQQGLAALTGEVTQ